MKIISLFTGIGAFEEALRQNKTKTDVLLASDNGERYLDWSPEEIQKMIEHCKTNEERFAIIEKLYSSHKKPNYVKLSYLKNHKTFNGKWYEDVRFIDGKAFFKKADLLVGGSPCQAFSTYGKRRGIEDARGTLFYEYIRLVKESMPKSFIYENVTGLMSIDKGKTFERSIELFESIGYKVKFKILNAANFGLPQLRRRVFIVGIRNDLNFEFNFPKEKKLNKKVSDYYTKTNIANKYYLTPKGYAYVTTHSKNKGRAKVNSEVMNCQTATQQFNWTGEFVVENATIDHINDKRVYVHTDNTVARKLIPAETVALMGFKNFKFPNEVPDVQKWRQSGNSIAVPVLRAILKELEGIENE